MQPISLKLENFGPYEDSLIDFSSFYAQSLFLITGKTGAGKTTIFDGMCFALYGKTSGGLREGKEMRSNFAKIGNQTKVVFIFKQGDKTYEVVREPEQLVKKQRGEGFREKPAEVSLTIYDNNQNEINQLTKQKEVGIFLGDLLQLNEQQFSQIVMLPQGEFRRFLNADSDSKEKVLRKLFNTYFYQDLAESLRQKKKTKENLLKEVRQELEILVKQINWQENFKKELEDNMYYQDVLTYYEKQSDSYSKELLEKERALKEIHQEQEKLQLSIQEETSWLASFEELTALKEKKKNQSTIEESIKKDKEQVELLQKIEKQVSVYQQLKNLEVESNQLLQKEKVLLNELVKIKTELKEQQVIVENLELKKTDMSIAQNEIKEMTLSEPLFEKQKSLLDKKIQVDKQLTELKTTETKLEADIQQIETQMNEWQLSLNNQLVLNEEKNQLERKQVQNESRLAEIKNYLDLVTSLDKKNQEIVTTQTELKSKQLVFEETSLEFKALKSNWAKAQIAKLSLDLMPDEACPVCGSLDHPAPSHGEDMTKEEFAKLEEELENSEVKANQTRETIATLEKSLEFFISDSLLIKEKIVTAENLINSYFSESIKQENWLTQIETEKLETSERLEENKKQMAQLEKIKVDLEQEKIRNIELTKNLKVNTEETKSVEHELIQLITELKNVQENLPDKWNGLTEMLLVKNKLIEETTQWEASLKQRKEIIEKLVKEKLINETTLKNISEQKTTITKKLLTTRQDMEKFSQANQLDMERIAELFEELSLLPNLLKKIQDFEKNDYLLTKELARLTELLKDKVVPDISPLLSRKEELVMEESKQQQLLATISYDIKQNENLIQTIKNKEQAMKKDLEELEELAELTNVMTGDGPHKLSMERFVLQTYLKRILQRANEKLVGLTNGRYRFELKEEQASFKKKTGLEINIFDDNVGSLRSVNTLSGGESFIAALSLALSLAEVIQEESGGIQIDAMFIDEGFGSLDEDALEMAIRALENIEGDGRLIGIISHVRELKERIPQQLAVKSTLDGKSYVTERLEFE